MNPSHLKYLKESLAFLDRQMLISPSRNEQIDFDFQGLRRSYADNPAHPDASFVARFGRVWIYDVALSIYADLKAGRLRQAGYQAGRVMQLALREEERGFAGLWHFSYNTQGDIFIDPRGPMGANAWCMNAIYAYILASGNAAALSWANKTVANLFFGRQVTDSSDPRHGLIRAGLHNKQDAAQKEAMGYRVYEGDPNVPYEHVILEHNADAAGTFRLAYRATECFAPQEKKFLEELVGRHDLLMKGMRRGFWKKDHFVSAMKPDGTLYEGTDRLPSIAVDNNTWAAHVFLPYDLDVARGAIRCVEERFETHAPPAAIEDLPAGVDPTERARLHGLFYFPATFSDPFVSVADRDREKLEKLLHPEAAFGFVLFLADAAHYMQGEEGRIFHAKAQRLYEESVCLQQMYGPSGVPYASANVPAVFTTLHSVATAATGVVTTKILEGAASHDFIGVVPPVEFVVDGKPPKRSLS